MLKKLAFVCLVLALSVPAYALTMTPTWAVHPTSQGWQTTGKQFTCTNLPDTPLAGDCAYVNEGNWGTGNQLAQTFAPTTGFNLKAMALAVGTNSGTLAGPITIKLYDMGTVFTNWNAPATLNVDDGVASEMWSVTLDTPGTLASSVLALNFDGSDLIELFQDEVYAVVISETVGSNMTWRRSGASAFLRGQMWRNNGTANQFGSLASWDTVAPRNAGLWVGTDTYVIPEPATMALLGLGGLALLRRKK